MRKTRDKEATDATPATVDVRWAEVQKPARLFGRAQSRRDAAETAALHARVFMHALGRRDAGG